MSKAVTANIAFDPNEYRKIGLRGTDLYIQSGQLVLDGNTTIVGNVTANYVIANNNFELVELAPNGNQNNYVTGINPSRFVSSMVYLKPVHSSIISGISTTGWDVGKVITIRNDTSYSNAASTGRLLIFEPESVNSSAGNQFWTADTRRKYPIFLMPEDEIKLLFTGSFLKVIGGNRNQGGTNGHNIFDEYIAPTVLPNREATGAGSWYSSGEPNYMLTGNPTWFYMFGLCSNAGDSYWFGAGGGTVMGKNCALSYQRAYSYDYDVQIAGNTSIRKVGLLSNFSDRKAESNTPLYSIGWCAHGANSANNWMTETSNTMGILQTPITQVYANSSMDDGTLVLGCFVNGDATQVDFFYSTTDGRTWNFTTTNHTSFIPRAISGANNANISLGMCSMMSKTVGTNFMFFHGWGTPGSIGLNS